MTPPGGNGDVTAAGLTRRKPRSQGAERRIPGSDGGARGATTSQRSPEEVRAMLARFRTGQQAASDAKTTEPGR
jgi:hypothetical protein